MILLTFKDTLNEILKSGAFYIALSLVIIIAITVLVMLIANRKKK